MTGQLLRSGVCAQEGESTMTFPEGTLSKMFAGQAGESEQVPDEFPALEP